MPRTGWSIKLKMAAGFLLRNAADTTMINKVRIEEMPDDFAIRAYLVANQTDVKGDVPVSV